MLCLADVDFGSTVCGVKYAAHGLVILSLARNVYGVMKQCCAALGLCAFACVFACVCVGLL